MKLTLIAVGEKLPAWAQTAVADYAGRLPRDCPLNVVPVAAAKRGRGTPVARLMAEEADRLLAAVPKDARVIALEVDGRGWSTEDLAQQLHTWRQDGRDVAFLIGGADGLDPVIRARADQAWSLSPLTLPHALARVVVAEQLYRAWSILANHPYHRAG